jgi:MFS family permease
MHAAGAGDAREINLAIGVLALAFTLGSGMAVYGWGKLLDRRPAPHVLTAGLLAGALGSLPIAWVDSIPQLAAARFAMGILAAGFGPAAMTLVRAHAPRGMEGRVLSYAAAFSLLGIGAGPFVAGQVGPWLGLRAFFLLNSLLLLALLAAWWRACRPPAPASAPAPGCTLHPRRTCAVRSGPKCT